MMFHVKHPFGIVGNVIASLADEVHDDRQRCVAGVCFT